MDRAKRKKSASKISAKRFNSCWKANEKRLFGSTPKPKRQNCCWREEAGVAQPSSGAWVRVCLRRGASRFGPTRRLAERKRFHGIIQEASGAFDLSASFRARSTRRLRAASAASRPLVLTPEAIAGGAPHRFRKAYDHARADCGGDARIGKHRRVMPGRASKSDRPRSAQSAARKERIPQACRMGTNAVGSLT